MIRALVPADAAAFQRIRAEALIDSPASFAASPEDDGAGSIEAIVERLSAEGQAIIGAFRPELVGVAGIYRDRLRKMAHKAHVWGVYVRPEARGVGVARELIRAAIACARTLPGVTRVQLTVNERSPGAAHLYRSLGFVTWGVEPAGMVVDGVESDETHMQLVL